MTRKQKTVLKKHPEKPKKSPDIDQIVSTIVEPELTSLHIKECPQDRAFFLNDGRVLRTLLQLADALDDMPPDVFSHHVNDQKNDFAAWIREVFDEPELADRLQLNVNRDRHEIELLRYMLREFLEGEK